jgi:hypothetical protein
LENSKELSGLLAVADALRAGVLSAGQVEAIVAPRPWSRRRGIV